MKKRIFASMAVTLVMAAALATAAPAANLNKTTINVTVGSSVKVKIKGAKTASWSVKDSDIATVSVKTGKKVTVTGVKAGSTKLMAEVNGKTFKADIKVAEKAAPAAPATTTSKLQEFANYVKSKGKLTYGSTATVKDNYQLKNDASKNWTVLPNYASNIGYEKNQNKILIFRRGKNTNSIFEITADANNLIFKVENNYDEIDVRFINTSTDKPFVDEDNKVLDGSSKMWEDTQKRDQAVGLLWQAYALDFFEQKKNGYWYDEPSDTYAYQILNEKRYASFGNIKDVTSMKVVIPLNGNAATATFAHNTDVDFRSGVGQSKAFYSEYTYQFNIATYNPEGAYGWTLTTNSNKDLTDGHDYIENYSGKLFDMLYGNYPELLRDTVGIDRNVRELGVNPSIVFSRMLSGLLNVIDAMMVDNKTGFDLRTIGFNAYTNLSRALYTDTMRLTSALYNVRWENIFFY